MAWAGNVVTAIVLLGVVMINWLVRLSIESGSFVSAETPWFSIFICPDRTVIFVAFRLILSSSSTLSRPAEAEASLSLSNPSASLVLVFCFIFIFPSSISSLKTPVAVFVSILNFDPSISVFVSFFSDSFEDLFSDSDRELSVYSEFSIV